MARTKKTIRPETKTLKTEHFRASDRLGVALPQLILAIELDIRSLYEGDARDYQFNLGREWLKIEHQTAGHRSHQRYLLATLLTPKTVRVVQGISTLAVKWFNSQASRDQHSLDSIIDYRADLKTLLNADCNWSHGKMEEGLYPIDIQFVPDLAADVLPQDLDDLIQFRSGWERAAGCLGRWNLYVLATNSD